MKDELTELMHSEFTVSEEIDRKNRVGSAIESAMLRGGGEKKSQTYIEKVCTYIQRLRDVERLLGRSWSKDISLYGAN